MGRTRTPAGEREAKGNPGHRPIAAPPAVPVIEGDARAPSWLSEEAAAIWARLAPELTRLKLLQSPDAMTFGRYCQYFALWQKANRALQVEDLVKETVSEHVTMDRLNKNLQAALLLDKRLTEMEDRFGLNPANRQRIFALRAQGSGQGVLPGELPLGAPAPASHDAPLTGFLN